MSSSLSSSDRAIVAARLALLRHYRDRFSLPAAQRIAVEADWATDQEEDKQARLNNRLRPTTTEYDNALDLLETNENRRRVQKLLDDREDKEWMEERGRRGEELFESIKVIKENERKEQEMRYEKLRHEEEKGKKRAEEESRNYSKGKDRDGNEEGEGSWQAGR